VGDMTLNPIKLGRELNTELTFFDGSTWQDPTVQVTATSPFALTLR